MSESDDFTRLDDPAFLAFSELMMVTNICFS